jgi:putative Ca2+/H+ antiporter (TMEM165/GDT1 family)
MHWTAVCLAFAAVLTAEFGDKTQLLIFSLASGQGSFFLVFLRASIALTFTSFAVAYLSSFVSGQFFERAIKIAAGLFFIGFGVLNFISRN